MSFTSSNDIINAMLDLLREKLGDNIKVIRNFTNKAKAHPLSRIAVTVGSDRRIVSTEFIGDNPKKYMLEIEVAVFVPFTMDSALTFDTLDRAIDILKKDGRFVITRVKYEKLTASRDTGSFEVRSDLTTLFYETEG